MIDLTEDHREMLLKYIKFFKVKNDHSVKEVALAIKEIKEEKYSVNAIEVGSSRISTIKKTY